MRSAETQGDEVRRCSLIILKKIKNPMLHKTASDLNQAEGEGFEPSIRNFVCRLSRAVQSTTLPSFHDVLGCELQRRGEGFAAGWAGARNREAGIYQRTKGLSRVTE